LKAYCLIRSQPHYRHEAFIAGLKAAGYTVIHQAVGKVEPGDVLVIWNRYGSNEQLADQFEARGGRVLVAENGYIGRDAQGRQHYAIAEHGHNGSGRWPAGDAQRWAGLNVELKPWRGDGSHVLLCPNRPFGMRGFEMPVHWVNDTLTALRQYTRRPIRVRPHPGNWQAQAPQTPLADDLANAWAVVIWASSAGVHALAAGIPVICTAPHWICKDAAFDGVNALAGDMDSPFLRMGMTATRQAAFERLAWAQWTVDEIAAGVPFVHLLQHARQG
jgi:hypothetical protein